MSLAAVSDASTEWWARPRVVGIVVDTPGWFDPFAERLARALNADGDMARCLRDASQIAQCDVVFYLSCLKLTPPETLARSRRNIVVHASSLPKGRGFSPMPWQILEGAQTVPLTVIEAGEGADEGPVLLRDEITFEGWELHDELRHALGCKVVDMCLAFMRAPEPIEGEAQSGETSWYPRRRPADSRLDPYKTIVEQFNLLRICDNERYPAFFELRGHRYALKIEHVGAARED